MDRNCRKKKLSFAKKEKAVFSFSDSGVKVASWEYIPAAKLKCSAGSEIQT